MLFVLSLVHELKSQNGKVKQIEMKNRTYYFCSDMINLKNFESNLVKIDKQHYKGIDIYYTGHIAIK